MKSIAFLLVFLFIISSCSDNTVEVQNDRIPSDGGKYSTITYTFDPSNLLNPFDSIGYWHNEALDEFLSNKNLLTCDSASIVAKMKTIYSDWFDDNPNYMPSNFSSTYVDSVIDCYFIDLIGMHPEDIIEDYSYNDTAHIELDTLVNRVRSYVDTTSPAGVLTIIKNWESDVITENYSMELKEYLLKNSSIARWSISYWYDVFKDEDSEWWSILGCNASNIKGSDPGISFIDEETQGYIAVGLADLIGGVSLGLPGAVTGSTSMAIYWFEGKTILDALEDAWNWFIDLW